MKRTLLALLLLASPALGQQATVTTSPPTYDNGVRVPLQADANGNLKVVGATGASSTTVQGNVASGAADSGNPVKIGCVEATASYTTQGNGQREDCHMVNGGIVVSVGGSPVTVDSAFSNYMFLGGNPGNVSQTVPLGVVPQVYDGTALKAQRMVTNGANTTGTGITAAGLMAQFDDASIQAITENSFGNLRMSTNHNLYGTLRDAAGNERGANVNASNALLADIATVASGAVSTVATGVQKVGIADSAGAALPSIANSLDTTGSGYIGTGQMGQLDDTSPSSVTENRFAVARIGAQRQTLNAPLGAYPYSAILGTAAVPIRGASGNVANANAVATLTGTATTTVYITGFTCTAGGATAAAEVDVAITGTLGGTLTYTQGAPLGAGVPPNTLNVNFTPPYPASAVNTTIVVTMPALGTGNAHAACVSTGFYL